ncbi:hypothetical protein K431DRAFT_229579 [Polychaeton citri CBS 116435]|uniref:Bet v1-like protein n=1 Tax=Polychaeton citri CBS 116435 TaxID=1314669 RepID=A0A9P4UKF7_9PEZI|nr:hypothetical protein K431DRAFT_229579 [Polychaeton citri CBS 116435]
MADKSHHYDSSYTGPRTTSTIPSGGVFSCYSSFSTHVAPKDVHSAIIHYQTWPEWNTFVPSCIVTSPSNPTPTKLESGSKITFRARMDDLPSTSLATSKEIVTKVDSPPTKPGEVCRICWVFDNGGSYAPGFVMKAERVNEIEVREDGGTDYRTWETFAGPVAYAIRWKYGASLDKRFDDWRHDLKKYVEGRHVRDPA